MKRKTNRKGEVKAVLEKRDLQIGNFVFTDEDDAIRVQSLGGEVMYRVSTLHLGGGMRKELMLLAKGGDDHAKAILGAWNATCMNVLAALLIHKPQEDGFECMKAVNDAVERAIGLNANLYGIKPDIPQDEDDAITAEEKEDATHA